MTDKQIIIDGDKFEKAENEPINQEAVNKFIEETDKFYIDDLDTRCPYHCNEKIGQCNNSSQETPHTYCIDNKDCIYKLYARKEQESDQFKELYNYYAFDRRKPSNIEELKICINGVNEELIRLQQENEELTSKCSQLEESFKETADGLLKIQYALADHCNKYSKTLTEIKEIVEPYYTLGSKDSPVAQILQKINECEGDNEI